MSSVGAAAHHGSVVPSNEVTIEATAHMDDYDTTPFPDNPPPHFNSTILSHAYYLFVQRVGQYRAGRVLHNVPSLLSPRPTLQEVSGGVPLACVHHSRQRHRRSCDVGVWRGRPELHRAAIGGSPCGSAMSASREEPVPGTLPASVQLATIADSTPSRMSSSQVTVLGAGARVST
jgi:hypothetical protein